MPEDHFKGKRNTAKDAAVRLFAWSHRKVKGLPRLWSRGTKRPGGHAAKRREAIKSAADRLSARTREVWAQRHRIKRSFSSGQAAPPQQEITPPPQQITSQPIAPLQPDFPLPEQITPPQSVLSSLPIIPMPTLPQSPDVSLSPDLPLQPVSPPPSFILPSQEVIPSQPVDPPPSLVPPLQETSLPLPIIPLLPDALPPSLIPPPQPVESPPQVILTPSPQIDPVPPVGPGLPEGQPALDQEDEAQRRKSKRGESPAPQRSPRPGGERARRNAHRLRREIARALCLFYIVIGSWLGYNVYTFFNTTQITHASQILALRELLPPDNLKIYDGQGNLIDQLTDQGIHTEVTYDQIAQDLVNATIAIEDRTFWSNDGIDVTGILRSALTDMQNGQPIEGGSTITQQLIKQLIVGGSPDMRRKLTEMALAPQVNNHYSKRDILEMYLNTIYYGHQAYGIDAAATVYFGLEDTNSESAASQLDLAQAALLAGLPRNAALYDPSTRFQSATNRFLDVLNAMVAQGYISQSQADAAYQEEQSPDFFESSPSLQDQAPHFDEYVLSQLEQMYHLTRSQLSRSGLLIYTTLNLSLQQGILKIMQQHIAEIRDAHHVTNAAEVLIDFHTGAILSMLGSIDYSNNAIDGQFNVALAYRQPGSSFKPYVYATAFEQGASPAQAIDDAPTTFSTPGAIPPVYAPRNDDFRFHGHMTLRCALQNSLNVPAVRVLQHVGVNNALGTAQIMGITNYQGTPGLSMALGGLDVRLLDHTSAIGVFADGGVREPYYSISKIVQSATGKVLFQQQPAPGVQIITPQVAYLMTNVLSDNTSRIPVFSKCSVLQLYSNSRRECLAGNRGTVRPAAAKTGTTQDLRDGWTVGYTTDYVMGVWTGNDDNSPMVGVSAEESAAPIWHDAMLLAEQGQPIRDFQNPGGLVRATATYPDGVKTTDWFLPGTVPASARGSHANPIQQSYCSTYSFAFPPPAGNGIPANGNWW